MTPTANTEIRKHVTMLLEQHQRSTVRLTPIFEAGDKFIYRVDITDGRALLVRVFPAARPIARVRGDLAILEHPVAAGIPAERPVAVIELDGRGIAVTEYIAGSRSERTAADLHQLGNIAGRLGGAGAAGGRCVPGPGGRLEAHR